MTDQAKPPEGPGPEPFGENMTAEQLIAFARKRMSADILGLDPKSVDPKMHYRWVRIDGQSIARARLWGYQTVTQKGGVKPVVESDRAADGAIRRGDLVLMAVPRHVYDTYVRSRHMRTEQLLASTSAETEEAARQKGVKVIKDSDHNRETMEIR